jgi:hypothetical protein
MIVYILFFLSSILALYFFWNVRKLEYMGQPRMSENKYEKIKNYFMSRVDETEVNKIFIQSGLVKINAANFQAIRYTFFIIGLAVFNLGYQFKGGEYPSFSVIFIILLFICSSPITKLWGQRTPFKIVMDTLTKQHRYKQNLEIYRAVSQLKNLSIIRKNDPISSSSILDQLRKFTKTTRPIFNRMISKWDLGKQDEACQYFEEVIGTREAEELSSILSKLDQLNPVELQQRLTLFQKFVRSERETKKKKQNENKGNVIYLIVVLSAILVLVNFAVVAFFIEAQLQLKYFM